MPTFASDQMLGATAISATLAYIVPNSASPDGSTGYLSRTPAGASGNSQFWISVWIKLGKVGVQQEICSAYGGGTGLFVRLLSTGELQIQNYAGTVYKKSNRLFRDPTAWGHLFLSFNGATSIDGYWNGGAIAWGTNGTLPASYDWHNNVVHRIFSPAHDVSSLWTGYAAHFASGSGAVGDVNDCGEADADGNWAPKNLTGLTFGTNGFWLKFENGADLGEDSSGNGNDFTVNGTIVQTADTPTDDAANDIGNYCTFNPQDKMASIVLSNGNRTYTSAGDTYPARCTHWVSERKWYFEFPNVTAQWYVGMADRALNVNANTGGTWWSLRASTGNSYKRVGGSGSNAAYGSGFSGSDVGMCAVDMDNGEIWWGKGGTWFASGDPAAGTNAAYSDLLSALPEGGAITPFANADAAAGVTFNFGQVAFAHTPPTGFLPICTANLPAPATAASVTPITGSFTGNANANGPFVWLGYTPDTAGTCTINGNAITWGTHAIPMAGGFKVITSSSSYNTSGSNTFSIAVARPFGGEGVSQARAQ